MLLTPGTPLSPLEVSMLGRRDSFELNRSKRKTIRDADGQPTLKTTAPDLDKENSFEEVAKQNTPSARQPMRKSFNLCATPEAAKEACQVRETPAKTPAKTPGRSGLKSLGLSGSARRVRRDEPEPSPIAAIENPNQSLHVIW